jgi:hypothetical protein
MEIIIGIIVGLFAIVGLFFLIRTNKKEQLKNPIKESNEIKAPADGCCGTHEVCEFDKLKVNTKIIEYFEDEDLDAYKDIREDAYSNDQIEQFRDVLYTLNTDEIKNWLLSLERRNVQLPLILKSEARMLMTE